MADTAVKRIRPFADEAVCQSRPRKRRSPSSYASLLCDGDAEECVPSFFDLPMLLLVRSCSKRLHQALCPRSQFGLWERARPPDVPELFRQPGMTLAGMKLLHAVYGIRPREVRGCAQKALVAFCERGECLAVRWFAEVYGAAGFECDDLTDAGVELFLAACRSGCPDTVCWVVRTYDLDLSDIPDAEGFLLDRNILFRGHLALAKWLVDRFGMPLGEGRELLSDACQGGNVATAAWVAERCGVSAEEVRAGDNSLLRTLLTEAPIEAFPCIVWLVEAFGFVREEIQAGDNRILRELCGTNRTLYTGWLVRTFQLSPAPVLEVLHAYCAAGRQFAAVALAGAVELSPPRARVDGRAAVLALCAGGHLKAAGFLVQCLRACCLPGGWPANESDREVSDASIDQYAASEGLPELAAAWHNPAYRRPLPEAQPGPTASA